MNLFLFAIFIFRISNAKDDVIEKLDNLNVSELKPLNSTSNNETNSSELSNSSISNSTEIVIPEELPQDEIAETLCFNWWKMQFFNRSQNFQHINVVPFQKYYSSSDRIHAYSTRDEIIIFNECRLESHVRCSQEMYAILIKNTSAIKKIEHTINPSYDYLDAIYTEYDSEVKNEMFKMVRDDHGVLTVLKLCDISAVEKKILKIKDYGWRPYPYTSHEDIPEFRMDTILIILRSPNKDALVGEHFDLVLYGGQSDVGSFNDISFFSTSKKRWFKPIIIGNPPYIKGHSAVVFYEEFAGLEGKIIIFGGIIDSVVVNDIYLIEITYREDTYFTEILKAEAIGDIPSPRSGHKVYIRGNKMILIGGCNRQRNECYDDIYSLDLLKLPLTWTSIQKKNPRMQLPSAREGFALALSKDNILIFGGCNFIGKCYKDSYELEMKDDCLVKCPHENMEFDRILDICECKSGFSGENCDVSIEMRCPGNCSGHGLCTVDSKCLCSSNYYGSNCEFEYCQDNCMGHGICNEATLRCKCDEGYFGANCHSICPKNCTSHGACLRNECHCFQGFSGERCDIREGIQGCWKFPDLSACFKNGIYGVYGKLEFNDGIYSFQENPKSKINLVSQNNHTNEMRFREEKPRTYTGKLFSRNSSNGRLIPALIDLTLIQTLDILEIERDGNGKISKFAGARNIECENSYECSGNGVCLNNNKCVCMEGYTGVYCQVDLGYEIEAKEIAAAEQKRKESKYPDFVNVEEHLNIELSTQLDSLVSMNSTALGNMLGILEDDYSQQDLDINVLSSSLSQMYEILTKLEDSENEGEMKKLDFEKIDGASSTQANNETFIISVNQSQNGTIYERSVKNITLPPGITIVFNGSTPIIKIKRYVKRYVKMMRKDVRNLTAIFEIDPQEEAKAIEIRKSLEKKRAKDALNAAKRREKAQKMLEKRKNRKVRKSATELKREAELAAKLERQRRTCPEDCNENGICRRGAVVGKCECFLGWSGLPCDRQYCKYNCSFNGIINGGYCNRTAQKCDCYAGYKGSGCGKLTSCHKNCTSINNGICLESGICNCTAKYWKEDCRWKKCPNDCSGNGICINGKCTCYLGYFEKDCSISCLNNCSNHGTCNWGDCKCRRGFGGKDCEQTLLCEGNCSGNGKCVLGECLCDAGWEGLSCSLISSCPDNCSGRGKCLHGNCNCYPGFAGSRCEFVIQCHDKCSNRGKCIWGKCFCDPGYEGHDCSVFIPCPNNCSGHGSCVDGQCYCELGYSGIECEIQAISYDICEGNCYGKGICKQSKCKCFQGFSGQTCLMEDTEYFAKCRKDVNSSICVNNGMCVNGECKCFPGFFGELCTQVYSACMNNCTSIIKGACVEGRCVCKPGWEGEDCSGRSICPQNCFSRGTCFKGNCLCDKGFVGKLCSKEAESKEEEQEYRSQLAVIFENSDGCQDNCNGHGICEFSECLCYSDWEGQFCEIFNPSKCIDGCNKRGVCRFGRCFCFPGFFGELCETVLPCPLSCSRQGICRHGVCHCLDGFIGKACELTRKATHVTEIITGDVNEEVIVCPNDCFGRGLCIEGVCFCEDGYFGFNCGYLDSMKDVKCPNDCNDAGNCISGSCYCHPGFHGIDCSKKTSFLCPGNGLCSNNGKCVNGKCECEPFYSGLKCEKRKCSFRPLLEECSYHGICKNGNCFCDPGYSGLDCSIKFSSSGCPGDCSSKGKCFEGKCICIEGYSGDDCTMISFRFSETVSNNSEDYNQLQLLLSMKSICKNGCNGNGKCQNSTCYCNSGYIGSFCEIQQFYTIGNNLFPIEILPNCKNNSDCSNGDCINEYCEFTSKTSTKSLPKYLLFNSDDFIFSSESHIGFSIQIGIILFGLLMSGTLIVITFKIIKKYFSTHQNNNPSDESIPILNSSFNRLQH